jgi:hypothetical protein
MRDTAIDVESDFLQPANPQKYAPKMNQVAAGGSSSSGLRPMISGSAVPDAASASALS